MFIFLWWGWAWLSALVNIFFEVWIKDIVVVDKYKSEITEKLEKKWIKVIIWDDVYNYKKDDIIIYSDAVINSKDFIKIKENIKFTYFEVIWELSKRFQTIAIAWTHWKTSTTAMSIVIWKKIKWADFVLWIVWWFVPDLWDINYYINKKHKEDIKKIVEKIFTRKWARPVELFKKYYFIVEADEFNRHFLLLDSFISCITKVDYDHKDVYKTKKEYLDAFELFKTKTRDKIFEQDKIKTYNIDFKYIFWEHMQKNASLVIQVFKYLWFKEDEIIDSLKDFKWIWRRQEYLWKLNNIDIYTDYAHHPVELQTVLKAFKEHFKEQKIIWIFQPHQIFRFISYKEDFIKVLRQFDEIILYDIYSVREENLLKELTWKDLPVKEQKKIIWENIAKQVWWIYIEKFNELIKNLDKKEGIWVLLTAWDLDYEMRKYIKNQSKIL